MAINGIDYWFNRFKDDEPLVTKKHTENYNGHFNAYVPEARVEVVQLDDIRHCIIFQHINESDSGVYVVRALNALGEAVCEAEIEVNFPDIFALALIIFNGSVLLF